MFLTQKRNGTIKGQMVYNGKPNHNYISRYKSTITTASLEIILTTTVTKTHKYYDYVSSDVPNYFIKTDIPDGN